MGQLNAAWHLKNTMPKNPTLDQRVKWHLAHAAACGCRDIPKTVRDELSARGLTPPPRRRGR